MLRTVGIVSRPRREDVAAVVPKLLEWLSARGLECFYDRETASCLPLADRTKPREELPAIVDLLIVLGGDGTLLATGRLVGDRSVPILPVNMGGLGFLTSVTLDELYPILEQALEGKSRISERIRLQAEVWRGGKMVERQFALNEAVLNKGALARMIDLDLRIDGDYACSYKADGFIVSTPTGSTAYSLSAGGPIIYPVVEAFVITPICPHTLTDRPLVIPNTARVEVDFHAGEGPVYLTVDGQVGIKLERGDHVTLTKAAAKLCLVRPPKTTYFEILRSKLKWGAR